VEECQACRAWVGLEECHHQAVWAVLVRMPTMAFQIWTTFQIWIRPINQPTNQFFIHSFIW
jgi:hypothetical protein